MADDHRPPPWPSYIDAADYLSGISAEALEASLADMDRQLAFSSDPVRRAFGEILARRVRAGHTDAIVAGLGLGYAPCNSHEALAHRNRLIRHLAARAPYVALRPDPAAAQILGDLSQYRRVRWPQDQTEGILPEADPNLTYYRILALRTRIPKQRRMAEIIARGRGAQLF